MNYKPLRSHLFIKILTQTEVKVAGQNLIVARGVNKFGKASKEWEDQILSAEVLKVGDEVEDVSIGDIVLIPGYAGKWVDADLAKGPETHRIIDESDILAIDEEATQNLKQKEAVHVA